MKVIRVNLEKKGYSIIVGSNILNTLAIYLHKLNIGEYIFIITTPIIKKIWGEKVFNLLIRGGFDIKFQEIADTEKSKSAQTCLKLLNEIATFSKSRKVFIIAFGGGVVGDVSGFIASVYKRGIPYIQLPTTLVAQVDSAIGGKVAIDLKIGKNLVGSFYQPRLVFSEIEFLTTLSPWGVKNGLSEIIKYGVINDKRLFKFVEDNLEKLQRLDKSSVEFVVQRSSQIKAGIVERDEFDKLGIRTILNYGHTIGHAIETASGYSKNYTHGMAISIGMIAANFISKELKLISTLEFNRIANLLAKAGLPTRVKGIASSQIYEAHLYDKKFIDGKNRFILPLRIGKVKVVEDIPERLVRKAINFICKG
ncbi:MAG: 3-dehydroquinate synthase [Candidatus Omnitrophica bacterium]|nr:3-dehydroquinate synthase [Candidatus Omnitrophota bacterium]